MARREPRVESIKWDKDILHKRSPIFGVGENIREREREKSQGFLWRFTGFHRS